MGLLTPFSPWMSLSENSPFSQPLQAPQQPNPFGPITVPQIPAAAPLQPAPVMPAMPSQSVSAPQIAQHTSLMERLNGLGDNTAFQLGLSLLGNAQNGGNWAGVGQDVRTIGREQMLRQREANEARRAKVAEGREESIFGRQQQAWTQEDQQRRDWESAVARETDPARQAALRAIGPQGFGQWVSGEQQRSFVHSENELNRRNDARVAGIRSANENSLGRYFQAQDAQTLGELNQQSAQLQAVGLPQLRNLRNTIVQGAALTGQPVDYNTRITLGRYFNGSSANRQTLEVWNAQVLGPALETLRGLGAMSEREMEAAVNSMSNPNMTLGAAMQLIDERIATAERRVATAQAAGSFFSEAGGLTGTRNSVGQDWPTYLQSTLGETPGSGATDQTLIPRGGYIDPPAAALADLRRDTSAAARQEFDQTFGPGAAQRALAPASRRATTPGAGVGSAIDALGAGERPPRTARQGYRWERRLIGNSTMNLGSRWVEVPDRDARR